MQTDKWEWPDHWDRERRLKFLNESLRFAEDRELFEQCAIIRDVKESLHEI
jgi:protein-arginine kinase activator protein McsA